MSIKARFISLLVTVVLILVTASLSGYLVWVFYSWSNDNNMKDKKVSEIWKDYNYYAFGFVGVTVGTLFAGVISLFT